MININNISGDIVYRVEINTGSIHKFELMKEDYINLLFSTESPINLGIGDYIEYNGSCYYITDKVYPTFNASTSGYDYAVRFDSHYYRWKNHILFYDRQNNKEASWSLTRSPEAHLGIIVSNLRYLGFTFNGKEYQAVVDSSVNAVAKLVQYENTNIIDALTKIAEAWECEWWVDEDKICIGKLEHGDAIDLEIGIEINSMSRSQSQDVFATRLFAFGSTRNIPSDYRAGESNTIVEGVVQKRLMLPSGTSYVDVVEGLDETQIVEAVVIFDDIYPRTTGTITEVEAKDVTSENESGENETYTVYRFKDSSFTFSKDYVLSGQELHVVFQTGPLSGMDFAVSFNPDGISEDDPESQIFEIVRNNTYGQTLPASPLIPNVGDQYILYNFDTQYVSDTLIPLAEKELLDRTIAYKAKIVSDPSTYTCILNSYLTSGYDEDNGLLNHEKAIELTPGQKVNLINKAYFHNGRISRVIGFEKKLDIPYDSPSYTIGESAAYSKFGELEQKIENIQIGGNTYVNQGGSSNFYVIKKDDTTAASDENVFSALRTLAEISKVRVGFDGMYLRKDIDDIAHGIILFDEKIGSSTFIDDWKGKGWEIQSNGTAVLDSIRLRGSEYLGGLIGSPTFTSGFTGWGWQIDTPTATGEFDNIFVRKTFTAYEVVYSQIYGLGGSQIVSDINKIGSVENLGDRFRCYMDDMDGLMLMNLRKGDGVRIQKKTGTTSIKYIFGRCIGVDSDYFDIAIPLLNGSGEPEEGDFALRWGNEEDTDRQGLIYLTSADSGAPYIDVYDGIINDSTEGKLKARLGHLTGIRTQRGDQLAGYGAYLNGVYVENSTVVLNSGDTIEQTFIAMNGKFESLIDSVRDDMSGEDGNVLRNSSFTSDTNYWTYANNVYFIDVSGAYLWMNSTFYVEKEQIADIYNDNGKNVLRLRNSYILQQNYLMNLPVHSETESEDESESEEGTEEEKLYTYSFALNYKVVRAGTLYVGIPGTDLYEELQLSASDSYQKFSKIEKWNEKGDFKIQFTGEILIYGVTLRNDALADAEIRLWTEIEQTNEYIKLLATKEYVDTETKSVYIHYDSQLSITAEQMSGISTKVDNINNTIENAGWITEADGVTLFAKKEMEEGSAIVNAINVGTDGILISAERINLIGAVTFNMFNSVLQETINEKVNEATLGSLAYLSEISKDALTSELVKELEDKADSSQLGLLAYLSEISKDSLDSSLISEIEEKVNSGELGELAYEDLITKAFLDSSLADELERKVTADDVVEALSDYALITTLSNYVTNSELANRLANYALSSTLSNYVTSSTLSSKLRQYATQTEAQGYASAEATDAFNELKGALTAGTTDIIGGVISTNLIDVDSLYATSLAAVRGTIGGWYIGRNYLSNSSNNDISGKLSGAVLNMFSSSNPGGNFLRMNPVGTSVIAVRADNKTGISINSTSTTGLCLSLKAQTGSLCVDAFGGCDWYQRDGETWNMPGLLAVVYISGANRTPSFSQVWGNGVSVNSIARSGTGSYTLKYTSGGSTVYPVFTPASTSTKPIHFVLSSTSSSVMYFNSYDLSDNEFKARDAVSFYIYLFGRNRMLS